MITFKIEKETKWNSHTLQSIDRYVVWAGSDCLAVKDSEEEANKVYESAKQHYRETQSVIIKEENL